MSFRWYSEQNNHLEDMMKETMIERLQAKTATEALVERVRQDFNLSPVVARTLLEQMHHYIDGYTRMPQETGQMKYLAVSKQSPAGRKVSECKRIPVTLTLHNTDDLIALGNGVAVLRQQRILRLTEEAYEQGALLSHEDLACLLSSSLATIKRDVAPSAPAGAAMYPPVDRSKILAKALATKPRLFRIIWLVTLSAKSNGDDGTALAPFDATVRILPASTRLAAKTVHPRPTSGAPTRSIRRA